MSSDGSRLAGARVLNMAINIPADVAAARLCELGASVVKVEPPSGDPVLANSPAWYRQLTAGHEIHTLDLKQPDARAQLELLLADTDVLLTSTRLAALERLGLDWPSLEQRHPRLVQVAIVGHRAPRQNLAGHDLTYAADAGLLSPPQLPLTLIADLGGAERAVSSALALLIAREHEGERYAEVALEDAARFFAAPLQHGITGAGRVLGGGEPYYGLYRTRDGWLALAALEPHFQRGLRARLQLPEDAGDELLAQAFAARTGAEWAAEAQAYDLPLAVVNDVGSA